MDSIDGRGDSGTTRPNTAKERFTRKMHLYYLSQPKPQALLPFPNPRYYIEAPRPISKLALKYVPTKRINVMSSPVQSKIVQKYEKPEKQERVVEPAALLAVATPRVIELAKPLVRGPKTARPKDKILVAKSRSAVGAGGKISKKSKKWKQSQASAIAATADRELWFSKNAVPRKWPPTPHQHPNKLRYIIHGKRKIFIKEKKKFKMPAKKPVEIGKEELYHNAVLLSIPSKKREKFKCVVEKDDFAERRQKKIAAPASDNVRRLAQPKQLHPEAELDLKFNPYRVKRGALLYKANERILTLATPINKKARVDSDIKDNPFGVVKRALKAICSKRLAELAIAIQRE